MRSRTFLSALCLLLAGCAASHHRSPDATPPISLDTLRAGEQSEGCGCSFSLRPQDARDVPEVFARALPTAEALVRVNGSLVRLTKLEERSHAKRPGHHTVGDTYRQVWASGAIRVVLEYHTTFACRDGDTACEVTRFQGTMVVRVGETGRKFRVWGNCGC